MGLADREGIQAVTMRRVGAELGVEAMSLYRHVPNKEALLTALHALMLEEVRHHDGPSGDWKERLRVVMQSLRRVYLAHPAIAQLSVKTQASDVAFIHFEQDLATMVDAGFSFKEAGLALRSLLAFTTGFVMREITNMKRSQDNLEDESFSSRRVLGQYPHLRASYAYLVGSMRAEAFEYGLERLLDGIENERQSSSG
jgi:AcrR family transcriptional regulator